MTAVPVRRDESPADVGSTGSGSCIPCWSRAPWTSWRRRGSLPERKVLYQFTARGHDVTQVLLGADADRRTRRRRCVLPLAAADAGARSRLEDALASTMMRSGSVSEGRDIGVVFNLPRREGPCVLPACGGVGAQYTPVVGWAQSLQYRAQVLRDEPTPRQHRGGSRRRSFGGDERLLVGAHDRDDAAPADPVLHRRQRLRHLGEVRLPDARRQHRREPRGVPQSRRSSKATAPIRVEAARPDR